MYTSPMGDKEFSALDHKEQQLFSNTFSTGVEAKHHNSGRAAPELPHAWVDQDKPLPISQNNSKSFGLLFLLFSLILLLVAITFTGWKFINKKNVVANGSIETVLSIKPFVEGGENTPVSYSIQNKNTLPLLEASFSISYEKGTGAQDEQNKVVERIYLGTVAPGELRKGDIQVQLYGAENSSRDIAGKLEYKVNGSNAVFSKSVLTTSLLKTPPLSVHIDGETAISANDPYPITIRVKNTTNNEMDPSILSLTLPASYVIKNYSEKPINKTPSWGFGKLAPGEEKIIKVDGTFKGATGEAINIKAVVGSQGSQIGTIANVYSSDSKDITLIAPSLSVSVALTQETGDISASTILPGSRVRAVVTYENKSDVALSISSIVARISGNKFDKNTISVDNGLFDSTVDTITWDGATQESLGQVSPGARGSLIFTFFVAADASTEAPLILDVKATASTLDQTKEFTTRDSKSWFIQGGAQVGGLIAYKNSTIVNTGPLPPVANQSTTYTVTISAQSDTTLKNSVASLKLPPYVTWKANVVDNAAVTYSDRTRTVTWSLGNLEKGSLAKATFQVSVRPSLTHVGTSPAVTSAIVFEGTDVVSGQMIRDSGPGLTTYLGEETGKKDISNVVAQ